MAKLAGIPKEVLKRSKEILTQLEIHGNLEDKIRRKSMKEIQFSLFSDSNNSTMKEIKDEIESLDTDSLTPLEALQKINEWKKKCSRSAMRC